MTHDYPVPGSHAGAFVQARVDLYRRMGHDVDVFTRRRRRTWYERYPLHYDVIAAHYPLPDHVIRTARRISRGRTPIVAYLHGAEAIHAPGKPRFWAMRAKAALRRFLRECAQVVTASTWMQSQVRAYLGKDSVRIPNPVDPELFPLVERTEDRRRGVCIRGSDRKYGVDVLRDAIAIVNRRGFRVDPAEIVTPVFPREELADVLTPYAYFVAPSRLEGQGLMACEAAATGMPVLTTDAGGIPEFISGIPHLVLRGPVEPVKLAVGIEAMLDRLPIEREEAEDVRARILDACGPAKTVERDIDLFYGVQR